MNDQPKSTTFCDCNGVWVSGTARLSCHRRDPIRALCGPLRTLRFTTPPDTARPPVVRNRQQEAKRKVRKGPQRTAKGANQSENWVRTWIRIYDRQWHRGWPLVLSMRTYLPQAAR